MTDRALGRWEALRRWRQSARWSPVVWLPLAVYWLLTERAELAVAAFGAGGAFLGIARLVVWASRCPSCGSPFGDSSAAFARAWNDLACEACGGSLFELRRGGARQRNE